MKLFVFLLVFLTGQAVDVKQTKSHRLPSFDRGKPKVEATKQDIAKLIQSEIKSMMTEKVPVDIPVDSKQTATLEQQSNATDVWVELPSNVTELDLEKVLMQEITKKSRSKKNEKKQKRMKKAKKDKRNVAVSDATSSLLEGQTKKKRNRRNAEKLQMNQAAAAAPAERSQKRREEKNIASDLPQVSVQMIQLEVEARVPDVVAPESIPVPVMESDDGMMPVKAPTFMKLLFPFICAILGFFCVKCVIWYWVKTPIAMFAPKETVQEEQMGKTDLVRLPLAFGSVATTFSLLFSITFLNTDDTFLSLNGFQIGLLPALWGCAGLPALFILAKKNYSADSLLILSQVLVLVSALLMYFGNESSFLLYLGFALGGFSFAVVSCGYAAAVKYKPRFLSLYPAALYFASSVSDIASGELWDSYSWRFVLGVALTSSSVLLLSIICLWYCQRANGREQQQELPVAGFADVVNKETYALPLMVLMISACMFTGAYEHMYRTYLLENGVDASKIGTLLLTSNAIAFAFSWIISTISTVFSYRFITRLCITGAFLSAFGMLMLCVPGMSSEVSLIWYTLDRAIGAQVLFLCIVPMVQGCKDRTPNLKVDHIVCALYYACFLALGAGRPLFELIRGVQDTYGTGYGILAFANLAVSLSVVTYTEGQLIPKRFGAFNAVPEDDKVVANGGKAKKGVVNITEHLLTSEECAAEYQTSLTAGLSSSVAASRLTQYGPNKLSKPPATHWFLVLLHHLFEKFALLLWTGAILCAVAYIMDPEKDESNIALALALLFVVLVTGIFSWYQEAKSASIMASFENLLPAVLMVVRDGQQKRVAAEALVPGDVVLLKRGEAVPADIRVVEASGLKVDNSSMTGEPEPLRRHPDVSTEQDFMEAENIAFLGTNAVEGRATGIVLRTGDRTVIGGIASLASQDNHQETPIAIEIDKFIQIITIIALSLGFGFLAYGLGVGERSIISNIVFCIGIIVANVPEGLLATVTVALTLTAKEMAKKNVLVKHLESVETLGSTTCIASDKTGTLTQNRMTVAHLYYDNEIKLAAATMGTPDFDQDCKTFKALHKVGVLCNKAVFEAPDPNDPKGERQIDGDAGEKAFIKFFDSLEPVNLLRDEHLELAGIPFKSANKYQVTINDGAGEKGAPLLSMKGAPERVWTRCSHVMKDGTAVAKTDKDESNYEKALGQLMGDGERVLGVAVRTLNPKQFPEGFEYATDGDSGPNFPMEGFCFVGLVSLVDPPRHDVPDAVASCQSAGVKVIMVTGDHPKTAEAIAKSVGIINGKTRGDVAKARKCRVDEVDPFDPMITARVVTGMELGEMSAEELSVALDFKELVFARTSPVQKLEIVEAMQLKKTFDRVYDEDNLLVKGASMPCHNIIAVTGDGVNDSPALRQANIGVAMGTGSDVAKQAADMLLLDDSFSSIVKGVEEGRKIFDNLKKSIAYTLTSNIPEIAPFLMFMLFSLPLAMETILILCIDLGTDMIPAIALAYEKKEADIMSKPPRDASKDRLVTPQLISWSYLQIGLYQAVVSFFIFFVTLEGYGFPGRMMWGIDEGFDSELSPITIDAAGNRFMDVAYPSGVERVALGTCAFGDVAEVGGPCFNPEEALRYAQSAYFLSIILCQIFTGLAAKTRTLSLFQHGMDNHVLNFGIFTEICLVLLLCYFPSFRDLGTRPIPWQCWCLSMLFAPVILIYDEVRKWLIRRDVDRSGCVNKLTYY